MVPKTFDEMDDLRRSFDRMFESFLEAMPRAAFGLGAERVELHTGRGNGPDR